MLIKKFKYKLIGQIYISPNAVIEPKAELIINHTNPEMKYQIEIGDNVSIKDYSRICPRDGYIKIGKNSSINAYCILLGYGGIDIGEGVRIAAHSSIIAFNHKFDNTSKMIYQQGRKSKGIIIEDDVWIGTGTRILDGVTIGKGSVIGAGSVVTKSIPPYSIAVGVPAFPIKNRN